MYLFHLLLWFVRTTRLGFFFLHIILKSNMQLLYNLGKNDVQVAYSIPLIRTLMGITFAVIEYITIEVFFEFQYVLWILKIDVGTRKG